MVRAGVSPADALRHARMEFGPAGRAKEDCRDARFGRLLRELAADVRSAWRQTRATRSTAAPDNRKRLTPPATRRALTPHESFVFSAPYRCQFPLGNRTCVVVMPSRSSATHEGPRLGIGVPWAPGGCFCVGPVYPTVSPRQ